MKIKNFITKLQNMSDVRKKIVLWTIVAILGLVMGFFWVKGAVSSLEKIGESVGQVKIPEIQTPEAPDNTALLDQTADWKTYINEEYGFEIKYPNEWYIKDLTASGLTNANLWMHIQNNTEGMPMASDHWKTASFFDISVANVSADTVLASYINDPQNIKKIDIGGKQYEAGIPFDDPFSLESVLNRTSVIYIINQQKIYMLTYSAANIDEYTKNKSVFGQMLSTFKFTK